MELNLKDQLFVVGGASSGLGKAVAESLIREGAHVIAIARGEEKLNDFKAVFPTQVEILVSDITAEHTVQKLTEIIDDRMVHGIVVNAGGPPAMTVMESNIHDWDNAYQLVLRWKVNLLQALVPAMIKNKYGRILFIESASVKQPMENLVLSNAFRVGVIGFMKTFSHEVAGDGITLNALAPGYHDTDAIQRIIKKKSEQSGKANEQIREQLVKDTGVGYLGATSDFASLAIWLLSQQSRYITGQTITVAGDAVKGLLG